jgi:hypothetical protein
MRSDFGNFTRHFELLSVRIVRLSECALRDNPIFYLRLLRNAEVTDLSMFDGL